MNFKTIVRFLLDLKLGKIIKPIKRFIPKGIKRWVSENRGKELISVEELKPQYKNACQHLIDKIGKDKIGDYIEFGVCHGTSMNCMNEVLRELNLNKVRLIGFDSFEGLPEVVEKDDTEVWHKGQFKTEIEETKYFLTKKGIDWNKTFLVQGWFSDTLTRETVTKYNIQKASLIMVDCDMYSSAKEALTFCKPLILDTAVLIFDDWNSANLADRNMGEKRAFQEFLDENPHFKAEEFGVYKYKGFQNGQLFVVTNTAAGTNKTN